MTSTFPRRLARKIRQTRRLSRKSIAFLFLLAGSTRLPPPDTPTD
ncbi:hypothetical protein GHA29_001996 [Neisseria gonorrhoeae]